jgi:hypothetical protein
MRTISIPALALCLLTPLLVLAQPRQGINAENPQVTQSPLFWYWMVVIVVAVAAFIGSAVYISRRKGPPSRPRIS